MRAAGIVAGSRRRSASLTVVQTLGSGGGGGLGICWNGNNVLGRNGVFTANANYPLRAIEVSGQRKGAPGSKDITCFLCENAASGDTRRPNNILATSSVVDALSFPPDGGPVDWVRFVFPSPYSLVNGVTYSIVWAGPSAYAGAADYIQFDGVGFGQPGEFSSLVFPHAGMAGDWSVAQNAGSRHYRTLT